MDLSKIPPIKNGDTLSWESAGMWPDLDIKFWVIYEDRPLTAWEFSVRWILKLLGRDWDPRIISSGMGEGPNA